ncbi:MAG TPA: hypothetical protein VES93_09735 [Ornithinibacter sp.]|nr:hypothetical protein [Ornithinibacter sp.]
MSRALAVARVHAVDVSHAMWPWAILAISFVVNVSLWVALRNVDGFQKTTGGLLSLYVTAVFVAAVSVSRQLPFMLGLGVTRAAFMGGSLLYAGASAAVTGVALTLLNVVESATDGFGQGGKFFRVPWLTDVPTYQLLAVYAVPMLLALALGAFSAGLYARFGSTGMLVSSAVGMAAVTAAVAFVTASQAWGSVGAWVASLTPFTLTAWLFVVSAGTLGATHLVLRRVAV